LTPGVDDAATRPIGRWGQRRREDCKREADGGSDENCVAHHFTLVSPETPPGPTVTLDDIPPCDVAPEALPEPVVTLLDPADDPVELPVVTPVDPPPLRTVVDEPSRDVSTRASQSSLRAIAPIARPSES